MSRVSTLGLPCRSGSPGVSAGSNQAPVAITATRGITLASSTAAGETCAAAVEHPHHVAVGDAAPRGVRRIDADRLAARRSSRRATPARDPSGCAAGRPADASRDGSASVSAASRAEPLRRREPRRVRGAVVVAEAARWRRTTISMRRDGVLSGCLSGSRRKSSNSTKSRSGGGISTKPSAQNCWKPGSGTPCFSAAARMLS